MLGDMQTGIIHCSCWGFGRWQISLHRCVYWQNLCNPCFSCFKRPLERKRWHGCTQKVVGRSCIKVTSLLKNHHVSFHLWACWTVSFNCSCERSTHSFDKYSNWLICVRLESTFIAPNLTWPGWQKITDLRLRFATSVRAGAQPEDLFRCRRDRPPCDVGTQH